MKPIIFCVLLASFTVLLGEDPKLGATREEVTKLLGEPSGRIELRDGSTLFSYGRGSITFDKTKAIKIDLISERQAEEDKKRELAERDALAQKNAPGTPAFFEKKRRELDELLGQFFSSKGVGNPVTYFCHKSSAIWVQPQGLPDGQKGLTVAIRVGSDGRLSLVTKYIGFRQAEYNQVGASFAQGDFLTKVSTDVITVPMENDRYQRISMCSFGGKDVEDFILQINASSGKKITFATYYSGRSVDATINSFQSSQHPTSYEFNESDKRALKKAVELAECFKTLRDANGGEGVGR